MKSDKSIQNLKPVQPGEIRNPKGRGNTPNRSTIAKKWLEAEQSIKNPITGVTEVLTQEDLITLALIKKAREGDVQAYSKLMDSLYGTPQQSVNVVSEENSRVVQVVFIQPEDSISDPIE